MDRAIFIGELRRRQGEPGRVSLPRDGKRDLIFIGWRLGEGCVGWGPSDRSPPEEWTRSTYVRIYFTQGGHWVGQIERRGDRGDGSSRSEVSTADHAKEIFRWLTMDGFGRATMEAWRQVEEALPMLPKLTEEQIP